MAARFGATAQTDTVFLLLTSGFVAMNVVGVPFHLALQRKAARWNADGVGRGQAARSVIAPILVIGAAAGFAGLVVISALVMDRPSDGYKVLLTLCAACVAISLAVGGAASAFLATLNDFTTASWSAAAASIAFIVLLIAIPVGAGMEPYLPAAVVALTVLQALGPVIRVFRLAAGGAISFWERGLIGPASGALFSAVFSQGSQLLLTLMAISYGAGTLSALTYGSKVDMGFYEVIVISVSTYFFPSLLSRQFAGGAPEEFFAVSIRLAVAALAPLVAVLAVGAPLFIRVLFERQAFGAQAASLASASTAIYAIALLPMLIIELSYKRLVALGRGNSLWFAFALGLVSNAGLAIALGDAMGPTSLPVAFVVGSLVCAAVLWVQAVAHPKTAALDLVGRPVACALAAALPALEATVLLRLPGTLGALVELSVVALVSLSIYGTLFWLTSPDEHRRELFSAMGKDRPTT